MSSSSCAVFAWVPPLPRESDEDGNVDGARSDRRRFAALNASNGRLPVVVGGPETLRQTSRSA